MKNKENNVVAIKKTGSTSLHPSLKASEDTVKLRRTGSFYALLLVAFTFNIYGMKKENDIEPFPFTHLPEDIQKYVIFVLSENNTSSTLNSATQSINSLAQTNHQFHILINEPQFCLQIIKHLSHQFDCSNETAAMALQTQEAKNRLAVQKKFQKLFITKKFNIEEFNDLYALDKNYVDLNFTYQHINLPKLDSKDTLLINAAMCESDDKPIKIACLLKISTLNINYQNKLGETALIECAYTCDSPETFLLLCNAPTIKINLQDNDGNTALSHACLCMNRTYRLTCINILLKAGANPTIANKLTQTPLRMIKRMGDKEEIKLIESAAHKKQ